MQSPVKRRRRRSSLMFSSKKALRRCREKREMSIAKRFAAKGTAKVLNFEDDDGKLSLDPIKEVGSMSEDNDMRGLEEGEMSRYGEGEECEVCQQ